MTKRWKAVIEYRSRNGIVDVEHHFEEMIELHNLIERGPDWNAIIQCVVTLNRKSAGRKDMKIEDEHKRLD